MNDSDPFIKAQPILGHEAQINQLLEAFNSGKMPHAWMLTGPSGIGKAHLIHQLAANIIAYNDDQDALFGDPSPLSLQPMLDNPDYRQVIQGAHPDFLYIAPSDEDKNKSGKIKTEQIRALLPFFNLKSASGGWRIAIIDTLDDVNVNGANAMLKILEEPPEKAILFLICSQKGQVLPTIRSRCRQLAFSALTIEAQTSILTTHFPDADKQSLANLAAISGGSLGFAMQIAETDAYDLYEATCRLLSDSKAAAQDLIAISSKWGAARGSQKQMIAIAKRAFSNLLAQAAMQKAAVSEGTDGRQSHLLAFEETLITLLSQNAPLDEIARFHEHYISEIKRAEARYLDFNSVFLMLFHKIHSLAHPK